MSDSDTDGLPVIGWRERVSLPDLNVKSVKAKVDTGARSSALHAVDVEVFEREGQPFVRFRVHASQRNRKKIVSVEAKLLEMREVRNSGGKSERRPVIETIVSIGGRQWPIELTLTNRGVMGFPMLLGRQAVRQRFLVDSGRSYLQSSLPTRKLKTRKKAKHENSNLVEELLSLFDTSA
ncbi:MAG: RimK/LysX family protein [Cyanobacteria bacterium J06623_5]